MAKQILTGNEAVALGALRSGVRVVTGYPGTPSTGVIEHLLTMDLPGRHVEWSTNEKVAFEIAAGAAWAGQRALVTMKMSGVNVAYDALISIAYSGTNGGLVIYVADDPGVSAGMAEQDSRGFALLSDLPMLEPASVAEAYDLVGAAFEISERAKTPVFLRLTTAVALTSACVEVSDGVAPGEAPIGEARAGEPGGAALGGNAALGEAPGGKARAGESGGAALGGNAALDRGAILERDIARYTKAGAKICLDQHRNLMERLAKAGDVIREMGLSNLRLAGAPGGLGVVAVGPTFAYLSEALALAGLEEHRISLLKTVTTTPFPREEAKALLRHCSVVLVLEELEPFFERELWIAARRIGVDVRIVGKLDGTLSRLGEYRADEIVSGLVACSAWHVGTASSQQATSHRPPADAAPSPQATSHEPQAGIPSSPQATSYMPQAVVQPSPQATSHMPQAEPAPRPITVCAGVGRPCEDDLKREPSSTALPSSLRDTQGRRGDVEPAPRPITVCAGAGRPCEDDLKREPSSTVLPRADLAAPRPITVCAGCPHRGTYMAIEAAIKKAGLKKDAVMVTGDIGCTILGMNPPFELIWNEVSMGSSISLAQGYVHAGIETPVIATIGDSTFFHGGIPGLLNAVQHRVPLTLVVMDNGWTAMTGMQVNPGTDDAFQAGGQRLDLARILPALGADRFDVVDPYDLDAMTAVLADGLKEPGVKVVLARRECAIQARRRGVARAISFDASKCVLCKRCIKVTGCPALGCSAGDGAEQLGQNGDSPAGESLGRKPPSGASSDPGVRIAVDAALCNGCGLCAAVCPTGALGRSQDGDRERLGEKRQPNDRFSKDQTQDGDRERLGEKRQPNDRFSKDQTQDSGQGLGEKPRSARLLQRPEGVAMSGRAACDVVLIGVGGQGILTIGELLLDAAIAHGVPATFSPTKGMAQRGGFVKAELRLGAGDVGPRIRAGGADAVVAMERSESLKGLPFAKPGGVFVLYDAVWEPTGVMLGTDDYPAREHVVAAIAASGARLVLLDPAARPTIGGKPASPNVFTLGALVAATALSNLLGASAVEKAVGERWPKAAEANLAALRSGGDVARAVGDSPPSERRPKERS